MSTSPAETLKDIIQVAHDGAEFYDAARLVVHNPALKDTFKRMATHKRALITALGGRLEMLGEQQPQGGTIVGALRQSYADIRASLSKQEESVYVAQLEAAEDRLLEHVEQAIAATTNPEIRSQLEAHLPTVRASHDEMRRLKQRWAA